MKVIFAGMPKTGTKSMNAALKILGYNVYDYMENFEFLGEEWVKIFREGGTVEDFKKMFENVDAVTDTPSCMYWEEISEAFPNAKIIFSIREEEEWLRSAVGQWDAMDWHVKLFKLFSPTFWHMSTFNDFNSIAWLGHIPEMRWFRKVKVNHTTLKQKYRRHNAYILEKAPKDKFLFFDPKEGWGPLCKFLGKDIPDQPYPHKNKKGADFKGQLKANQYLLRIQREVMFSCSILSALLVYGGYRIATGKTSPGDWIRSGTVFLSSIVKNLQHKMTLFKRNF